MFFCKIFLVVHLVSCQLITARFVMNNMVMRNMVLARNNRMKLLQSKPAVRSANTRKSLYLYVSRTNRLLSTAQSHLVRDTGDSFYPFDRWLFSSNFFRGHLIAFEKISLFSCFNNYLHHASKNEKKNSEHAPA